VTDLVRWLGAQLDADERRERGKYVIRGSTVITCPECPNISYTVTEHSREVRFNPCRHTMDGDEFVKTFGTPNPDEFVLADIAAKRQILLVHAPKPWPPRLGKGIDCTGCDEPVGRGSACRTVRLLAAPYAGRPGYKDGWRP
jgi:hypothetical protein